MARGDSAGRWRRAHAGAALLLVLAAAPARAGHGAAGELRVDPRVDVPVTVGMGLLWVGAETWKEQLAPDRCRWCDRDAEGRSTLNALDASARRALRWDEDHVVAARGSDLASFVLAPASALGLNALAAQQAGALEHAPEDALLVLEAVAVSMVLNQAAKLTFGRERPFVQGLTPAQKARTLHPSDNNASFYSGHTSLAFTLATASGTVASLRGYSWAPLVWGTGLGLAATAGYLRIAADRHYLTDVLVGALVGSAVGVAVPRLHAPEQPAIAQPAAGPRRAARPQLVLAWSW